MLVIIKNRGPLKAAQFCVSESNRAVSLGNDDATGESVHPLPEKLPFWGSVAESKIRNFGFSPKFRSRRESAGYGDADFKTDVTVVIKKLLSDRLT